MIYYFHMATKKSSINYKWLMISSGQVIFSNIAFSGEYRAILIRISQYISIESE